MKALDSKGQLLSEAWEYKRPPDVFEKNGLAELPAYLERLLASKNWFTSVTAFTLDDEVGISLWKMDGKVQLHESFDKGRSEAEQLAKALCQERGFPLIDDYKDLSGARYLVWELPCQVETVVEAMRVLAIRVHGIPEDAGLQISLEYHEDQRDKFAEANAVSFVFTYPIEDPSASPPE